MGGINHQIWVDYCCFAGFIPSGTLTRCHGNWPKKTCYLSNMIIVHSYVKILEGRPARYPLSRFLHPDFSSLISLVIVKSHFGRLLIGFKIFIFLGYMIHRYTLSYHIPQKKSGFWSHHFFKILFGMEAKGLSWNMWNVLYEYFVYTHI